MTLGHFDSREDLLEAYKDVSHTNEIFETTVNWHSLPAAGTGVNDPLLQNMNPTFEYPKD